MATEEDAEVGDGKSLNAAIRSAKKSARPAKIGVLESRKTKLSKSSKKRRPSKGSDFDKELGQKSRNEGVRAKRGDKVGGMGKKRGNKSRK